MIDLHTHTIFSDGELIPAELTRRAAVAGYRAIGLTDHGDRSNMDLIIPRLVRVADDLGRAWGLTVVPGIELTHIPPADIADAAREARALGAKLVLCHGETLCEPVAEATNSPCRRSTPTAKVAGSPTATNFLASSALAQPMSMNCWLSLTTVSRSLASMR